MAFGWVGRAPGVQFKVRSKKGKSYETQFRSSAFKLMKIHQARVEQFYM